MCNPQKENGYTPIANELLEAIYSAKFTATQLKILLCLMRYTYGFSRKEHSLSLSFMAKATGMTAKGIKKELTRLIEANIITVVVDYTVTGSRVLRLNKIYTQWKEVGNHSGRGTTVAEEPQYPTPGEPQYPSRGEPQYPQDKQKTKYKTNNNYVSVFDHYMTLDLKGHRAYTNDMQKAIETAMKNNKYDEEYCKTLLDRHKQVVEATKNTDYPVKERGLAEFFGQKVYGAKHLICSEYEEGGKYYEDYINKEQNGTMQTPVKKFKVDAS